MKKKILVGLLAFIGLITTIKLAVIYYNANFNPYALASFCSVNEFIDCDGIAKTTESQFFGIPLAYWGMFLYAFMFLMLFVEKLKNIKFLKFLEVFKNPLDYIASLGLISFVISIILLCLSLFEIKKLCILCAFTYVINFFIGCVATDFKNGGFVKSIKQSFVDFKDALAVRKYLIAFAVVMLVAAAFLSYTNISMIFAPQVKQMQGMKEFIYAKKNKYKVSGNILGSENPKVIVYVYSDYQCPICFAHNIMMHKLVKKVKGVQVVHKNLPLDNSCNMYMRNPMHEGACIDAKYAIASEKQGKFWEMNDILFLKKPKTEEQILELVKDMGFDLEKLKSDANSVKTFEELQSQIEDSYKRGIEGTPATMINNNADIGLKPFEQFVEWVEREIE